MGLRDIGLNFKDNDRNNGLLDTSDIFLPFELWIQIISGIDRVDILALSLTSRALRYVVQPLLFQQQNIYPFTTTMNDRRLERVVYVTRSLDRLKFLSGPRIAESIKELALLPYPPGHALSHQTPHIPENDIQVVDRIFEVLPMLTNLKVLVLHGIRATPPRLEVIQGLSLDQFTLETRSDDISWNTGSIPIPARHSFVFNRVVDLRLRPGRSLIPLRFLFPQSLQSLSTAVNGTPSVLAAIAGSESTFSALTTLEVTVQFVAIPEFSLALQRCPSLLTLRLRSEATGNGGRHIPLMSTLPHRIIPRLRTYHGPPSLAQHFIEGRFVQQAILWSSRAPLSISLANELTRIIRILGDSITHLEIGLLCLPLDLIETMKRYIPNLISLSVNTHLTGSQPGLRVTKVIPLEFTCELGFDFQQLDHLAFGIQLPENVQLESEAEQKRLKEVISSFPEWYNPFFWRDSSLEEPWSKLIWKKIAQDIELGSVSVERVTYVRTHFPT